MKYDFYCYHDMQAVSFNKVKGMFFFTIKKYRQNRVCLVLI